MHTIRLRSAWESVHIDHPAGSRQRFQRSFGKPTNLGGERVFLVIEPAPESEVRLNDLVLPAAAASPEAAAFRHDVTPLLNLRNVLSIDSNSPIFELNVRLEIVE